MSDNPDLDEIMSIMARRNKQDKEQYFIDLQTNERTILNAASAIYTAYIKSGKVNNGDEEK